ncbi:hypothetical protein GCM10027214_09920 [Stenotrophomonas tumulicola]
MGILFLQLWEVEKEIPSIETILDAGRRQERSTGGHQGMPEFIQLVLERCLRLMGQELPGEVDDDIPGSKVHRRVDGARCTLPLKSYYTLHDTPCFG